MMMKSPLLLPPLLALALLCALQQPTVHAFGGSNIFGVFRKRRRTLQDIQEKRVQIAARRGFAGPHGELLTVKEFEALQAEKAKDNDENNNNNNNSLVDQILNSVWDRFPRKA